MDSTQSLVHPRPKSSPCVGFIPWVFDKHRERSSGEVKRKSRSYSRWTYVCVSAPGQVYQQTKGRSQYQT